MCEKMITKDGEECGCCGELTSDGEMCGVCSAEADTSMDVCRVCAKTPRARHNKNGPVDAVCAGMRGRNECLACARRHSMTTSLAFCDGSCGTDDAYCRDEYGCNDSRSQYFPSGVEVAEALKTFGGA